MRVFLLYFTVLCSMLICTPCFAQNAKIKCVKIEFVGFGIESSRSVDCESFKQSFRDVVKKKTFTKGIDINKFTSLVNQFKTEESSRSLDVRGILKFVYCNGKNVEYCFDVFGNFYLKGKIFKSKKLLSYISDELYSNHPEYLDK